MSSFSNTIPFPLLLIKIGHSRILPESEKKTEQLGEKWAKRKSLAVLKLETYPFHSFIIETLVLLFW